MHLQEAVPFMPGEHDTIGGVASYTSEKTFVSFSNSEYSETRLVEIEPDGLVERASVPGLLDMVQQAF